ncbi:hypothetical protein CSKR_106423, partial [Clonorchis sinensis]
LNPGHLTCEASLLPLAHQRTLDASEFSRLNRLMFTFERCDWCARLIERRSSNCPGCDDRLTRQSGLPSQKCYTKAIAYFSWYDIQVTLRFLTAHDRFISSGGSSDMSKRVDGLCVINRFMSIIISIPWYDAHISEMMIEPGAMQAWIVSIKVLTLRTGAVFQGSSAVAARTTVRFLRGLCKPKRTGVRISSQARILLPMDLQKMFVRIVGKCVAVLDEAETVVSTESSRLNNMISVRCCLPSRKDGSEKVCPKNSTPACPMVDRDHRRIIQYGRKAFETKQSGGAQKVEPFHKAIGHRHNCNHQYHHLHQPRRRHRQQYTSSEY